MDLLPDDAEAAKAILKDAEAAQLDMQARIQAAYDQWRASTEEVKKALAFVPAPG